MRNPPTPFLDRERRVVWERIPRLDPRGVLGYKLAFSGNAGVKFSNNHRDAVCIRMGDTMDFAKIGLHVPEILLPRNTTAMDKWAVVACDQYTSQPAYWQKAKEIVGDAPSTLNLILPEVYLEKPEENAIIASVNATMKKYDADGVLQPQKPGFILVDRKTEHAASRKGLMVALDLECYDYRVGSTTLIRATEGTILDRLPPRMKVRRDAPMELPHIMVLIDDPDRTVIEPLFNDAREMAYDFELMLNGGHIRGYRVDDEKSIAQVAAALTALAAPAAFAQKHGTSDKGVLLYAMGDGNHSFATAKAIWEETKAAAKNPAELEGHPARYALVELVNLHDAGLEFEPIHRVVFDVDANNLFDEMKKYCAERGAQMEISACDSLEAGIERMEALTADGVHAIPYVTAGGCGVLEVKSPWLTLVVGTLQEFLDKYLAGRKGAIDYIHGTDAVQELGTEGKNIGFFLPAIDKGSFFHTIVCDGALPRKTFSMGEADEKRFYLECRKITR